MMSRDLPAVLQADHGNSISMVRALKNIKAQLIELTPEGEIAPRVCEALDDIDLMLAAIK